MSLPFITYYELWLFVLIATLREILHGGSNHISQKLRLETSFELRSVLMKIQKCR